MSPPWLTFEPITKFPTSLSAANISSFWRASMRFLFFKSEPLSSGISSVGSLENGAAGKPSTKGRPGSKLEAEVPVEEEGSRCTLQAETAPLPFLANIEFWAASTSCFIALWLKSKHTVIEIGRVSHAYSSFVAANRNNTLLMILLRHRGRNRVL